MTRFMRSAAALLALTVPLTLPGLAVAEAPKQKALPGSLAETERKLASGRTEQAALESRARDLAEEIATVEAELVQAARRVQDAEEGLTYLENRIEALRAQEEGLKKTLSDRDAQLILVATALQRLAWRPTEALLAQPTSPAATVRSAILLRAAIPGIEETAEAARRDLEALTAVRAAITAQRDEVAHAGKELEAEHVKLRTLLARKSDLQRVTLARGRATRDRVMRLAEEADSLRDLLAKLEEEKRRREAEERRRAEEARRREEEERRLAEAARLRAEEERRRAEEEERQRAEAERLKQEEENRTLEGMVRLAERAGRKPPPPPEPVAAATSPVPVPEAGEVAEAPPPREMARPMPPEEPPAEQVALARPLPPGEEAPVPLARPLPPDAAVPDPAVAEERPSARDLPPPPRGRMPIPARGRIIERYGQTTKEGLHAKGISVKTRVNAQVIAPHDGIVMFAGPFRGYGELLIIEHGGGYHTLLAGLGRINGVVGQRLQAGEPVGLMPADSNPVLYVELRRNGQAINPLPWLTANRQ